MPVPRRSPLSTYRLQLHQGFPLTNAQAVVDYLDDLGITDVYCSPVLAAEPGSTHGYNMVDSRRINPELGGREAFDRFADAVAERRMGLVLDIVPNHMGIASSENRLWMDVLENGRSSPYATFFDIDWDPPKVGLKDRVLLPILGDPYGLVLERGEIGVAREGGAFVITYFDRKLPCEPTSTTVILDAAIAAAGLADGDECLEELRSVRTALHHLPPPSETDPTRRDERIREKEVVKRRLERLYAACPPILSAVESALATLRGAKDDPSSFDALDAFLRAQAFRLCSWKVATEEINYRRFFDVNELAAVRMEDPAVFAYAHELIGELLRVAPITGLRLDHTDGLFDPEGYFDSLAALAKEARPDDAPLYVIAEKILSPGEALPRSWKIHGTTGYEFLADLNAVFVSSGAEAALTAFCMRFAGVRESLRDLSYRAKRAILRDSLASEVNVLARSLERIAETDRRSRDFTLHSLTKGIVEIIACFPVYRTYVRPDGTCEDGDIQVIDTAIRRAIRRNPTLNESVVRFVRDVLTGTWSGPDEEARRTFAMKFQQLTGPVTAKGVEDTAFYLDTRLLSLSEVGGAGEKFGISIDELHARIKARAEAWPLSMTTVATHDTKRGDDVRVRLDVLSEAYGAWRRAVGAWSQRAGSLRVKIEDDYAPSRNDEYLFYQSVVGACPFELDDDAWGTFTTRVVEYMAKASKEAKEKTSWINPNDAYDSALESFCEKMMGDPEFRDGVKRFVDVLAPHAAVSSLAQTAFRLIAPGVADTYQGAELWNLSLVDPDNRRPVDYDLRRRMLGAIHAGKGNLAELAATLLERYRDGGVKLFTTHLCLDLRRRKRDLFQSGSYAPIAVADNVVAFARELGGERVVCAVPRFSYTLLGGLPYFPVGDAWKQGTIKLPAGEIYRNVFTGERVSATDPDGLPLARLFATFPVAVLERLSD